MSGSPLRSFPCDSDFTPHRAGPQLPLSAAAGPGLPRGRAVRGDLVPLLPVRAAQAVVGVQPDPGRAHPVRLPACGHLRRYFTLRRQRQRPVADLVHLVRIRVERDALAARTVGPDEQLVAPPARIQDLVVLRFGGHQACTPFLISVAVTNRIAAGFWMLTTGARSTARAPSTNWRGSSVPCQS